jgi:hypothetical protein
MISKTALQKLPLLHIRKKNNIQQAENCFSLYKELNY